MVCSIGTATPASGVYSTTDKYTWRLLEGNVYGQYATRITGSILFHSVPYVEQNKGTLEWWEYDKLGTSASLGCVRLTVEDAKWIYTNCVSGTKVEFYSSATPGPLGKPSAKKISGDTEVRDWDPTDPDSNNPWTNYLNNKKEETKPTTSNPVTNTNTTTTGNTNSSATNNSVNNNTNNNSTLQGNTTSKPQNTVDNVVRI